MSASARRWNLDSSGACNCSATPSRFSRLLLEIPFSGQYQKCLRAMNEIQGK
jgi:hypothetical protein